MPSQGEVSQLLADWGRGDRAALEKLMPLVYDELHRIARRYMRRENPGHTLQTSALVNEAYLRLVNQEGVHCQDRTHFLSIAAQLMRRILIDHARSYRYAKRGGGAIQVSLDEALLVAQERTAELIAIDEALTALSEFDQRKGRIVELRFFGGLTTEEVAEVYGYRPRRRRRR